MLDLALEIQRRACPECGAVGTLDIALHQYRVVCKACRNSRIDPFKIGPWAGQEKVVETVDGDVVGLYIFHRSPEPERELNTNHLDFLKERFHGAAHRVIAK